MLFKIKIFKEVKSNRETGRPEAKDSISHEVRVE